MIFATSFWFVDLPWWGFWPLAIVAVIVAIAIGVAIYWILEELLLNWRLRNVDPSEEHDDEPEPVVYPYYVEDNSLRNLAETMKLELPTGTQITRSKKLSLSVKGTGGEKGDSQTADFDPQLPLLRIARKAEEAWEYESTAPCTTAADAVSVSDGRTLSATIEQIQSDFPTTSETAELLSKVQEIFSSERVEALAGKKREEYVEIAKKNQMLVFGGEFAFKEIGNDGLGPKLRLTAFNPTPGYMSARGGEGDGPEKPALIPIPEGVGLDVVLPDKQALTPAGNERILRGEPFFAGLIAHSPSFNAATGTLTCSAWAIWGEQTPNWEETMYHGYRGNGYYR
jgi:hypothetical protein